MEDLKLDDTGGHDALGRPIVDGDMRVAGRLMDGEVTIEICRGRRSGELPGRGSEAYLSIAQAKELRRYLKRLIEHEVNP